MVWPFRITLINKIRSVPLSGQDSFFRVGLYVGNLNMVRTISVQAHPIIIQYVNIAFPEIRQKS